MRQFLATLSVTVGAVAWLLATAPPAAGIEYFTAPRFKHQVLPLMPDSARAQHHTGTVMLKVLVDSSGNAKSFTVFRSSGSKDLDAAALAAVKASTYYPAKQGSKPVLAFYDVSYRFTLEGVAEAGGNTSDLERRLGANPKSVAARLQLAQTYLLKKNYARAESIINDGLKLTPNDAKLWARLGIAYYTDAVPNKDESKFKLAADAFDKALAIDSKVDTAGVAPAAYGAYAIALVQRRDYANALPYAKKAVQFDPKRVPYRVLLGISEEGSGQYDAALADLKAAAASDDKKDTGFTVTILTEIGNTQFSLGHESEGLAAINQAERVDPRNPKSYDALVAYYLRKGNAAAALNPLLQLAAMQPDNPLHQVRIGDIYLHQKNYDKAKAAYDKALAIDPRSGDALFGSAELSATQGRVGDADAALQKAVAANPRGAAAYNSSLALIFLGGTADRVDHTADAVKYARAATTANPNYASGWYDLGVALGRQGNKSDASDALHKAYNLFKAQNDQAGMSAASDRYKELNGTGF